MVYNIIKINNNKSATYKFYDSKGLDITPKNRIRYEGIVVHKLIIFNQSFIEQILKKRIKRKLEIYLKFIIDYIDNDSSDGSALREVLNDVSRYKGIINYKYNKYLDEKYMSNLLKKFDLIEKELNVKIYMVNEKQNNFIDEFVNHRTR